MSSLFWNHFLKPGCVVVLGWCKGWREPTRLETQAGAADWPREIAFALADYGAACLLWSQHATASKWAAFEKSKKDKKRKRKKGE